ncbi:two-component system response regulator CreB, partial [Arcobacter venerupis]
IKTIRAKLREHDPEANLILTHRGLGYSLELA